ncbi:MAG: farnesyl diphosphate synthase [Lachnospiraceae bacterium]|nr:farnesyl diphosphate synthase [Lachnospiraceae bacterium]
MSFKEKLLLKTKDIDEKLELYLPSEADDETGIIAKAMRYSVFAGGKRLRPIILVSVTEALGGDINRAYPFACALEMIHTYSLIHDDLPAMDNDDFRRGILTNHKVFGEDIAILAGDALLNQAFEVMSKACVLYNDVSLVKAMEAIARAAGVKGMLGGQVVDVINDGKKIDEKTLRYIDKNKTAAMISGAFEAGAYIAKADEDMIRLLYEAGQNIGIAFQIQDDILDVIGDFETFGKSIGSDEKNNKTTYVTMFGLEKAKEDTAVLSKRAVEIFEGMGSSMDFLAELTRYLIKRNH